ncbi:hypothetical protein KY285_034631 [Solanum tuberosum]|nr:hypothetical protein KY285_034631 [Solanum tuberosum]
MDIGTTYYLTANLDNLAIHSKYQGPEEVVLGASIDLNNILCVPTAKQNLISVSSFVKANNVSCDFFPDYFLVKDLATWDPMFQGSNEDGLYNLLTSPQQSLIQSYSATLGTWHARLGHVLIALAVLVVHYVRLV